MEEKKENEYIENVDLEILGVKLEMFDDTKIKKIRFDTSKGDITWKPSVYKTKFANGFNVETRENMTINELPEKLKQIAKIIQEKSKVKASVCYAIFATVVDDEEVTYRFIRSEKSLEKWKVEGIEDKKEE